MKLTVNKVSFNTVTLSKLSKLKMAKVPASVNILPKDVPGAVFLYASIEKHSVLQLRRWLLCRGLKTGGNKSN